MNQDDSRTEGASPVSVTELQLDDIVGTWFNTSQSPDEISKVELSISNEQLMIRAVGSDNKNDWGEATVSPYTSPGSPHEMTGFEAKFASEVTERHLAANLKYGVLVIQCYKHVREGTRAGRYFTREFFHQRIEPAGRPASSETDHCQLPCTKVGDWLENTEDALQVGADLSAYLGTWRNTYQHSRGIASVELLRDGERYLFHASGVGELDDWGPASVRPFAENVGSRKASGFFARYDLEFVEMELAANFNKGLLIIAAYTRFIDGSGRADYFTREFFFHEQSCELESGC